MNEFDQARKATTVRSLVENGRASAASMKLSGSRICLEYQADMIREQIGAMKHFSPSRPRKSDCIEKVTGRLLLTLYVRFRQNPFAKEKRAIITLCSSYTS